MIRGTFANIRLRNQLAPGTEGGFTIKFARGDGGDAAEQTTIYEASQAYQAEGTPLVILAGKEYGSGSSRGPTSKLQEAYLLTDEGHRACGHGTRAQEVAMAEKLHDDAVEAATGAGATAEQILEWDR